MDSRLGGWPREHKDGEDGGEKDVADAGDGEEQSEEGEHKLLL